MHVRQPRDSHCHNVFADQKFNPALNSLAVARAVRDGGAQQYPVGIPQSWTLAKAGAEIARRAVW